ncbi:Oidioi.mRNA.OKI2018_I69.chr1.g2434.t1.cds [Oikopleura dioica]|uniref:Oidioi.mRNA.OKI2018_I69.chr1.g2434.t1.cds n=1 Tax=Oikopleura dioica TaxID=34765 RepID=A0ABN7T088_OIKDI|nr:Oidioi.mRNA.OKI2018_I69.chr1.g2434.t1.cds [Oikopleura dioica]
MPLEMGLYDILGLPGNASHSHIKQAFIKLARESHPDKNPVEKKADCEVRFKRINHAYKVLSDGRKRSLYDKFGEAGLEDSGYCDSDCPSTSSAPFPTRTPATTQSTAGYTEPKQPQKKHLKKGKDVIHELKLSLEEFYAGTARKLVITRKVCCWTCDGAGGSGIKTRCQLCFGQAFFGPGLPCSECRGEGHIFLLKDKCAGCKGKRITFEKKVLDIVVPAGSAKETQLKFNGAADHLPGTNAGDVIVILAEKSHPVFERNGDNISTKIQISLAESLLGFRRKLKTLSGQDVAILMQPGESVQHNGQKVVPNAGMPIPSCPGEFGNLIIDIDVEKVYSSWLRDPQIRKRIRDALPPIEDQAGPEVTHEMVLEDYCEDRHSSRKRRRDDSDHSSGHPNLSNDQCRTQ